MSLSPFVRKMKKPGFSPGFGFVRALVSGGLQHARLRPGMKPGGRNDGRGKKTLI